MLLSASTFPYRCLAGRRLLLTAPAAERLAAEAPDHLWRPLYVLLIPMPHSPLPTPLASHHGQLRRPFFGSPVPYLFFSFVRHWVSGAFFIPFTLSFRHPATSLRFTLHTIPDPNLPIPTCGPKHTLRIRACALFVSHSPSHPQTSCAHRPPPPNTTNNTALPPADSVLLKEEK